MRKIKKGDLVIVKVGKDKGRQGTVLSVVASGKRVIVEGVNVVKRHTRGNPQQQIPGGIISKEASIDVSNVALFNTATGQADRVGFKVLPNGKKVRIYKSTQEVVIEAGKAG